MTSFNPTKYPHLLLSEEVVSLGRNETNTVAINDKKLDFIKKLTINYFLLFFL